jgi:Cu/Zn superoxide dismutase
VRGRRNQAVGILLLLALGAAGIGLITARASGSPQVASTYQAFLKGRKQSPMIASAGTGVCTVALNAAENQITTDLQWSGLTSNAIAAHIHLGAAGVNGGIDFPFTGVPAATSGAIPQQTFAITPAQVASLRAGDYYCNIHTVNNGGGEIRGQLMTLTLTATLTGAQETPPNGSAGTGPVEVGLNGNQNGIVVDVSFSGLTANATAGHIHTGAAGVPGPVTFPFANVPSATSGDIPEQAFPATAQQVLDLKSGNMYANIHNANFPGGEIRAQLVTGPTAVSLRSASAARTARGVLVRWRTGVAFSTAGFNVFRVRGTSLSKLNRRLVLALAGPSGHAYSFLDRSAAPGRRAYRIQAVDMSGATRWLARVAVQH